MILKFSEFNVRYSTPSIYRPPKIWTCQRLFSQIKGSGFYRGTAFWIIETSELTSENSKSAEICQRNKSLSYLGVLEGCRVGINLGTKGFPLSNTYFIPIPHLWTMKCTVYSKVLKKNFGSYRMQNTWCFASHGRSAFNFRCNPWECLL